MMDSYELWRWILFLLFEVLVLLQGKQLVSADDNTTNITRRSLLQSLLNESKYDPRIAPDFDEDFATSVTIQLYILSVDSLSEMSMDYSMDVFLRQQWYDSRLRFDNKTSSITLLELGQSTIEKVWIPDTYFVNEKDADIHEVTVPNRLMHIFSNGTVKYSIRVSLTLSCNFNLMDYPFDDQICPVTIESFGYSTENVLFIWHNTAPIEIADSLSLAQFELEGNPSALNCTGDFGTDSSFACLEGRLHFIRNTGYYMIQIFIPQILIVVLSWVSFWLDLEATPARISLGVLTVLTMTTQSSGVRGSLPKVSYVKAIDIWMATCLIFVFASLLEFAYINVTTRRHYKLQTVVQPGKSDTNLNSTFQLEELVNEIDFRKRARRIDKLSRVIFPSLFIIFNIIFWVYFKGISH